MAKRFCPKRTILRNFQNIAKFRKTSYTDEAGRKEVAIEPIVLNHRVLTRVIIDPHYRQKHSDSINEGLILELVRQLDGRHERQTNQNGGYRYYNKLLKLRERKYRLVWVLEDGEYYIGVINAYRDDREV